MSNFLGAYHTVPAEVFGRTGISKPKCFIVSELPKCYTVFDSVGKYAVTAPLDESTASASYNLYSGDGITDSLKKRTAHSEDEIRAVKTELSEIKSQTDEKLNMLSLKGQSSGEAVRISDAWEYEQTADVGIRGKNLIPYPYTDTSKNENGVTFTVNSDGTITANGTSTGVSQVFIRMNKSQIAIDRGSTYTLSGCPKGGTTNTYRLEYLFYKDNTAISGKNGIEYGNGLVITPPDDWDMLLIKTVILSGTTANNLVFKPQLELGTSATAYAKYVSDLSAVKVGKYGKNLIPYPYTDTSKNENGVTFTVNSDGSITVSGTATDYAAISLTANLPVVPGTTYTISSHSVSAANILYEIAERRGEDSLKWHEFSADKDYTFTISEGADNLRISLKRSGNGNECKGTFKPMLELGNAATEYEPYKAPKTYTSDGTGAVNGVTLDESTATLIPDTSGVIIDAKYKRDITKAFEELEQKLTNALISTGGNI